MGLAQVPYKIVETFSISKQKGSSNLHQNIENLSHSYVPLKSIKTLTLLSQHLPLSRFCQLIHTQKHIMIIADGYSLRHGLYLPRGGAYSLVSQIGLPLNDRSLKYIPSSSRKLKKEINVSRVKSQCIYSQSHGGTWRTMQCRLCINLLRNRIGNMCIVYAGCGRRGVAASLQHPPPPAGSVTRKDDCALFSGFSMQFCGSGSGSARIRIILVTWIRIRIKLKSGSASKCINCNRNRLRIRISLQISSQNV